jgi:hypothetical protein
MRPKGGGGGGDVEMSGSPQMIELLQALLAHADAAQREHLQQCLMGTA